MRARVGSEVHAIPDNETERSLLHEVFDGMDGIADRLLVRGDNACTIEAIPASVIKSLANMQSMKRSLRLESRDRTMPS